MAWYHFWACMYGDFSSRGLFQWRVVFHLSKADKLVYYWEILFIVFFSAIISTVIFQIAMEGVKLPRLPFFTWLFVQFCVKFSRIFIYISNILINNNNKKLEKSLKRENWCWRRVSCLIPDTITPGLNLDLNHQILPTPIL